MNKNGCKGFSTVRIFILTAILSFSLSAVNTSDSPYGINVHLAPDAVLGKVQSAGIKWIRVDILWRDIEVSNLNYLYGSVDRVVNYADKNGLSVLGVMAYSPTWTNSSKQYTQPPDNIALWTRFVTKTVNRYKNRVKYWSIWNEPNLEEFFAQGKDVFVSKIFLPAAQAIKAADSGAFIVGPDLAHKTTTGQEWYFWLKYILDNAGQYIDVISHHVYHDPSVIFLFELLEKGEALIPGVKTIIEEAGYGHLPFWITETGWHTYKVSEEVQADRYLEFLQRMQLKGYPHKVLFYEIIDDSNTAVNPYGILRASRNEKPAYKVYADFIAGLYPPLGEDDDNTDSKKCYAEETVASRGDRVYQRETLERLRLLRDQLTVLMPQGASLVRNYYRHASEFADLTRTDSRLFRLGQNLLLDLGEAWHEADGQKLLTLQQNISVEADELLNILLQKSLSPSFRRMVEWCVNQLRFISLDGLEAYKDFHLPRQLDAEN